MSKRVHVHYYSLGATFPHKRFTEKVFVSEPYDQIEEIRQFVKDAAAFIDDDIRSGRYGEYRLGHVRVFSAVKNIMYQEHRIITGPIIIQSDCDESLDCGVEIWVEKVPGPVKQFFMNLFRRLNA
uniref:Uncharacterized protein n=1 Tax=Serratia phage Kevin TaxID=3161161 RepID=A0AAU8KZ22_9CAUD